MFATFENKPNTQKIIGDNSATGREYITQREVDAMKIRFLRKYLWQMNAENLKSSDFYDCTQCSCKSKKKNLFLF